MAADGARGAPGPSTQAVSATIVLPAIDETSSLVETVDVIEAMVASQVHEVLFVVCDRTSKETHALCASYAARHPARYRVHVQRLPGLGGAVREAFALARGTHVVLMASDLETDPRRLPALLAEAESRPDAIVTASRWQAGGALVDYGPLRTVANRAFQRLFAMLYGARLGDLTYGYRVLPTALVQRIRWEELGHALLFETLVKPLRAGVPIVEVPAVWRPRVEGRSSAHPLAPLAYLRVGLRVRLRARSAVFA